MKRELKFRAWGRWGDWNKDETDREFVMIDGDSFCFEEFAPLCDLLKDQEDEYYFMQFTGLKDKNGKEIYEGDIVKYSHDWDGWDGPESSREFKKGKRAGKAISIGKVYWEGDPLAHYVFGPHRLCARTDCHLVEVIGNIHENPEKLS